MGTKVRNFTSEHFPGETFKAKKELNLFSSSNEDAADSRMNMSVGCLVVTLHPCTVPLVATIALFSLVTLVSKTLFATDS